MLWPTSSSAYYFPRWNTPLGYSAYGWSTAIIRLWTQWGAHLATESMIPSLHLLLPRNVWTPGAAAWATTPVSTNGMWKNPLPSTKRKTSLYKIKEHTCTSVKGTALKAQAWAPRASPPSLSGINSMIHPALEEVAFDVSPRQGQKLHMSKPPGRAGYCSDALSAMPALPCGFQHPWPSTAMWEKPPQWAKNSSLEHTGK